MRSSSFAPCSAPSRLHCLFALLLATLAPACLAEPAHTPIAIPMTAARWHAKDAATKLTFPSVEGFPNGVMDIKQEGEAVLNGLSFRDGTIEFDIHLVGQDIPGIRFRQQDAGNAEEFYIRPFPNCRASNDCIQYTPVINGFMLWNAFPQYQRRAPVFANDWNHVKLVVSGRRLNVFLNDVSTPILEVGKLESSATEGGLEVRGPAAFANLVVTPNATEGLSPTPTPDPSASDPRYLRGWQLSPTIPQPPAGSTPAISTMPTDPKLWKSIAADRFGFVNLNRQFTSDDSPAAIVWLRTTLQSDRDQTKHVSLGWIGQAWIFSNTSFVTMGKNFYYPDAERRSPDGRLSLENGSFDLPLHKGANEIAIALYSSARDNRKPRTHYGWGLIMRLDDTTGVRLPR